MQTDSRLHASHSHEQAEWSVALLSPASACLRGLRKGAKGKRMEIVYCATVKVSERLLSHFIVSILFLEMVLQFFSGFYSKDFLAESWA